MLRYLQQGTNAKDDEEILKITDEYCNLILGLIMENGI